jgi:hypothetical protein
MGRYSMVSFGAVLVEPMLSRTFTRRQSRYQMNSSPFAQWKHLKRTPHAHHPVDDAKGNAEAILATKEIGLKIPST